MIFIDKISYKNFFIGNDKKDHSRNEMILIALIMLMSMFALGLSFHNTQTSLPKVFEIRIDNINSIQIGLMIGIIYFISGATTFLGGLMADKFNLKAFDKDKIKEIRQVADPPNPDPPEAKPNVFNSMKFGIFK